MRRNPSSSSFNQTQYTAGMPQFMCCQNHDMEPITNICISNNCYAPLCPECIHPHMEQHKNVNTHAQIKSLKSVKMICQNKIATLQDMFNDVQTIDYRQVIQKEKQKLIEQIQIKFDSLEKEIQMKQEQKKSSEFQILSQDLNSWKDQLDSSHYREICEKIMNLDINSYRNNIQDKFNLDLGDIFGNPNRNQVFEADLDKFIHLTMNPVRDSMKKTNSQSIFQPIEVKQMTPMQLQRESLMQQRNSETQIINTFVEPKEETPQKNISHLGFGNSLQNTSYQNYLQKKSGSPRQNNNYIQINQKNFFLDNQKLLHFFPNGQRSLFIYDFKSSSSMFQNETKFKEIQLNINFSIPIFHKSITSPKGDVYLIGGSVPQTQYKSNQAYIYDFKQRTLLQLASMIQGRSSFAICWHNDYIYVIGGFVQGQVFTNACERYNSLINQWQRIAPLNHNAVSSCVCSFNNYLFKFGGLVNGENINHFVERYDTGKNTWTVLNVELEHKLKPTLFSTSCCLQINSKEILLFGGYNHENEATDIAYVLDTQTNLVKTHDKIRLPFAEGFWNNTPLIQNNMIYALQNVPNQTNDDCLENVRRILVFDEEWTTLNN